jgi:hypothetical protein
MSCTDHATRQTAVQMGTDSSVLQAITQSGVELTVWQRAPAAAWGAWLEQLPAHALPACRLELSPDQTVPALHASCDASGTPNTLQRHAFVADMAAQATRFAALAATDTVRLRLDVVTSNACRRWHRDCVPLRLLCTYRGPGTWWLPPTLAEAALANPDADNTAQAQPLQTQDVAVFKGCGWPGQGHSQGIVHRSPRIEGTGLVRLVLVLDLPHPKPSHLNAEAPT